MTPYTLHIDLYDLVAFGAVFTGFTLTLQLWFATGSKQGANRFLALALAAMVLGLVRSLAVDGGLRVSIPQFLPALGPMLYFYVRKLTQPDQRFKRVDWLHLMPLLAGQGIPAMVQALVFISVLAYLYACERLLQKYHRSSPVILMDRSRLAYRWLRRCLAVAAFSVTLWTVYGKPFDLFLAAALIWAAAAALWRQDAVIQDQSAKLAELKQKARTLGKAMETGAYHRDAELTVSSLAEKLNLPPRELSRIINIGVNKNFNDFINAYRVREVIGKMTGKNYDHLTLLGIAYESGFNSKSSFNRIFRELTGKSPAQYKTYLKKERPNHDLGRRSRPGLVISEQQTKLTRLFMFKNYFKTAFRSIAANKFYTVINIIGLTVGLVVGLFMLLWVQDELSFDGFNHRAANIYKIDIVGGSGPTQQIFSEIIAPVATFAKSELPQVKDAVRIRGFGNPPFRAAGKALNEQGAYTDASFFGVFNFPLIRGNQHKPFPDNHSIVITQTTAAKYFGNEDPMGKTIELIGDTANFKVTGIIADFPSNSSIKFDVLLPIAYFNQVAYIKYSTSYNGTGRIPSMDADWISFNYETYLLLKPGTDIRQLEKSLQRIHERNKPDDAPVPYLAQPLLKMHLYKPDGGDAGIGTVKIFAVVAILILAIACINYVNLSTARSILRAKEVSMRKIIGAGKWQLFMQFIVETTLLFMIAALLAIGLMFTLLPAYNSFAGKQMTLGLGNFQIWVYIFLTLTGTLAASSIYPALLLSSFEPLKALKGKLSAGTSSTSFRKILVVTQFTVSIMLIISTLIIGRQLRYMRNKNLGYNKENVFSLGMRGMGKHYEAAKAQLLKQPGIVAVSRSGDNIVDYNNWTGDNDWDGKPKNSNLLFHPMFVDKDFIPFMHIKMTDGSAFSGAVADSSHFILNEAAVEAMGLKHPIGTRLRIWTIHGTVIGVMQDFHFSSMRKKIEPAVFIFNPNASWMMYVKTTGTNARKAISATQAVWKQYNQDLPFEYNFLDDNFNSLYRSEQQTGALFNLFAAIAVLISCLGLLGLATYSAQVRTREIGIRKVLGASIPSIIRLLATEFILLILIAIFIALPIGWYAMSSWLQDFAYRIPVSWPVFVIAAASAVVIAFITISFQSVKAALANPVHSLRSE